MSNFLTRRRAMSMSLAALGAAALATPLSAQQSRWEYVISGSGEQKDRDCYLDVRTVSRPSRDVVVFWWKITEPGKPDVKIHETMTRDRLTKSDGGDWSPIVPETVMEAFYERLFK